MTPMVTSWLILTAGILNGPATPACAEYHVQDTVPTVHEIIQRYVEAVGGREAITRLSTRVMRGRLITDLSSRTPPRYEESAVEIASSMPNAFVMTTRGADGVHVDGYDGTTRWSTDGVSVRTHEQVDRRLAWFVSPQHAIRLEEYFPAMTVRGVCRVRGRQAYVVDIDRDESHALHFDVETGLLVRLGYNRELHDYREVDRVKMPFQLVLSRKGGSSTYMFDTIEHNAELGDSIFAMPHPQ